jgi:hypothetical protein
VESVDGSLPERASLPKRYAHTRNLGALPEPVVSGQRTRSITSFLTEAITNCSSWQIA